MENKCESSVKMFIRDIYESKQHTSDPNYFYFKDKLIRRVDIMGVVTEVRRFEDVHLYRVDDCTGEILCRFQHVKSQIIQEAEEINSLGDMVANSKTITPEASEVMQSILKEVSKFNQISMTPFEQGDCVQMQGFIQNYHETKQIWAFTAFKVPCPEDEVDRIFEVSSLYSKVYTQNLT